MYPTNFMHICTYRTKLYRMTAAVSLAACTCALGLPSVAFAENKTTDATATTAPAAVTSHASASSLAAGSPTSSVQSTVKRGTSSAVQTRATSAAASTSPETPAQPQGDSLTWTKDDFNISADGKTIGGRKDVNYPETGQTVNEYVDGLSAKGKEKLKKNHHVVIPEGIEVIHECAFTGHAKQVGNKQHKHIDGETYIEGVTLPQSLKIIEYGAFGWNKIKGTVVIPKNVVAVSDAAFVANEIEKVVFEGVLDDKGKEHDTDTTPYYLAGVGSVAFQGNKISEIVVKGNLGQYKFRSGENDSPFDNQNPGPFTIEVGEEYKSPIKITQEGSGHTISVMEGFEENGNPAPIDQSPYFKKNADGKYVAVKTGTLEGQCIFYDFVQGAPRMIGRSRFTYNILPKAKICTVAFVNETDQNYAKVQVKQGKSINDKSVKDQVMPNAPTKDGYVFKEWNTKPDGTGVAFTGKSPVKGDMTVYAQFKTKEPPTPTPAPQPGPYPLPEPVPVPDVPAPAPAPTPEPELIVPAIEAPTPTVPAEAPAPIVRKRPRALPQTSDPMAISAVGELGMIFGVAAGSLAAALRRKRLWKRD